MAEVAFAQLVVEEDLLAPLGHRALEPQGQYQVLLPPRDSWKASSASSSSSVGRRKSIPGTRFRVFVKC